MANRRRDGPMGARATSFDYMAHTVLMFITAVPVRLPGLHRRWPRSVGRGLPGGAVKWSVRRPASRSFRGQAAMDKRTTATRWTESIEAAAASDEMLPADGRMDGRTFIDGDDAAGVGYLTDPTVDRVQHCHTIILNRTNWEVPLTDLCNDSAPVPPGCAVPWSVAPLEPRAYGSMCCWSFLAFAAALYRGWPVLVDGADVQFELDVTPTCCGLTGPVCKYNLLWTSWSTVILFQLRLCTIDLLVIVWNVNWKSPPRMR